MRKITTTYYGLSRAKSAAEQSLRFTTALAGATMTSETRTRLTSYDVSDDSAVESDVSSLADGDSSEDCSSPPRSKSRRDVTWSPRSRACAVRKTPFRSVTSSSTSSRDKRSSMRKDRMLMRDWLQTQADRRSIPNMEWCNRQRTMIRVPWKHGSRSGWTIDDCQLYRAWAEYTGRPTFTLLFSFFILQKTSQLVLH